MKLKFGMHQAIEFGSDGVSAASGKITVGLTLHRSRIKHTDQFSSTYGLTASVGVSCSFLQECIGGPVASPEFGARVLPRHYDCCPTIYRCRTFVSVTFRYVVPS